MNGTQMASPRNCLLLVGYGQANTRAAIDFCNRTFFWIPRRQRIMTANSPGMLSDRPLLRRLRGWQVTAGSNRQHEFSGWQEGLDVLRAESDAPFSAVLVNDTVTVHRRFSLPRRAAFIRAAREEPASGLVGFTDGLASGAPFTIAGHVSRRWVSSYLMYLDARALARLDHRIWLRELNECCVPGGTDPSTFFSGEVSASLSEHLRRWLFERGWYRSEPLSRSNAPMFTLKARSIVNEILLSARARHPAFAISDPFERFPALARWDRRLKRWRMTLAEAGISLRAQTNRTSTDRYWRLR